MKPPTKNDVSTLNSPNNKLENYGLHNFHHKLASERESHRKIREFTEKSGNLQKSLGIYRNLQNSTEKRGIFFRNSKKNL